MSGRSQNPGHKVKSRGEMEEVWPHHRAPGSQEKQLAEDQFLQLLPKEQGPMGCQERT